MMKQCAPQIGALGLKQNDPSPFHVATPNRHRRRVKLPQHVTRCATHINTAKFQSADSGWNQILASSEWHNSLLKPHLLTVNQTMPKYAKQ